MSRPAPPSIDVLDVISPGVFAAAVSPLFEGAPRFLGRLAMARPFGTLDEFFARRPRIAHAMPDAEQLELIDAHPRLGAPPATVSALSFVEQGYDARKPRREAHAAEVDRGRVAAELDRLNARLRGALRVPLLRLRRRPVARGLLPGLRGRARRRPRRGDPPRPRRGRRHRPSTGMRS